MLFFSLIRKFQKKKQIRSRKSEQIEEIGDRSWESVTAVH